MADAPAQQRIDAIREFNRFYTRRIGVLGRGLLGSGCSLTEVRVLYEIAHCDGVLASDLARELGLDAGYLSRILARFHKRGWIRRRRSDTDARKTFLGLTPRGRKFFGSLNLRARDEIAQLLAPLPDSQQVQLQDHLRSAQALLSETPLAAGKVTLRTHRPGDIGWIIHRHGVLYAREYGWNEEFEALVAEICAKFIRHFDPQRERCWIAEYDGMPVGCIMLVRKSRTTAKLRLLLVESDRRGLGIGNRLVAECIRFAREAGYRRVVLWTQSILTGARRIYEAHGFKLVKSHPNQSFGAKLISETWQLTLQRPESTRRRRTVAAEAASS